MSFHSAVQTAPTAMGGGTVLRAATHAPAFAGRSPGLQYAFLWRQMIALQPLLSPCVSSLRNAKGAHCGNHEESNYCSRIMDLNMGERGNLQVFQHGMPQTRTKRAMVRVTGPMERKRFSPQHEAVFIYPFYPLGGRDGCLRFRRVVAFHAIGIHGSHDVICCFARRKLKVLIRRSCYQRGS